MNLFTPDLYRNFGIGFAAGAVLTAVGHVGSVATLVAAVPHFLTALF